MLLFYFNLSYNTLKYYNFGLDNRHTHEDGRHHTTTIDTRTIPTSDDSISPPAPKHACTSVSKSRVQKSSRAQCGRATNLNRLLGKGREHRCSERRDHLHTCCVPPSSFRTVACETRARASRIVPYVAPPREPGRFFQWSGLHGLQLQHILLLLHRRRLLSSIAAPSLP